MSSVSAPSPPPSRTSNGRGSQGGYALESYALDATGTERREATMRVSFLAGLEHAVLGIFGSTARIGVLIDSYDRPPLDFSIPWAVVVPLPGFLLAFWLAERYRDRLRDRRSWKEKLGIFLVSVQTNAVALR